MASSVALRCDDLKRAFDNANRGPASSFGSPVRALIVGIDGEAEAFQIQGDGPVRSAETTGRDFAALGKRLKTMELPLFVLFRVDLKAGVSQAPWVVVLVGADGESVPVKQRMMYASSKGHLKASLGPDWFRDDLSFSDLSEFHEDCKAVKANPTAVVGGVAGADDILLSARERALKELDQAEAEARSEHQSSSKKPGATSAMASAAAAAAAVHARTRDTAAGKYSTAVSSNIGEMAKSVGTSSSSPSPASSAAARMAAASSASSKATGSGGSPKAKQNNTVSQPHPLAALMNSTSTGGKKKVVIPPPGAY